MKQLTFTQDNPQFGKVKIILRLIGRLIYLKFNDNQYSNQIISQFEAKGARVKRGKGWIQINLFEGKDIVKLGEKEFNINETSEEEIEVILSDFYKFQYKKANFVLESEE